MTQHDDQRLVDYLFDELSEEEAPAFERLLEDDADLSLEVSSLGDTLDAMRALEPEDPPDWLSAKVMAEARQVAEATAAEAEEKSLWGRLRKLMWGPAGGLVGAGAVAVALAAVVTPQMLAEHAPMSAEQQAYELGRREAPAMSARGAPADRLEEAKADKDALQDDLRTAAAQEADAEAEPPASKGAGKAKDVRRARKKARRAQRRSRPSFEKIPSPAPPSPRRVGDSEFSTSSIDSVADAAPAPSPSPASPRSPAAGRAAPRAPAPAPEPVEAPMAEDERLGLSAPKKKTEAAKSDRSRAASIADVMLRAARAEVQRGEIEAARRVLTRAAQRLAGSPERGRIFLARADLELRMQAFDEARRYAQAALDTPGFDDPDAARALLRRIARASAPQAAPAKPSSDER